MAHRIFADSDGTSWLVIAVYPSSTERRNRAERRAGEPVLKPEPRRRHTRRQTVRRSMEKGWLVFKADNARRRLTPITSTWETCSLEELEELLRRSVSARRSYDPKRG